MTILLDGREPSRKIRAWVTERTAEIAEKYGWSPQLVTVQIGDHQAADWYMRNQIKACNKAGIRAMLQNFSPDVTREKFIGTMKKIAQSDDVDGIIIQTPLPKGWRLTDILRDLPPLKDVEGVHPENLGRLYMGEKEIPLPCTAHAAISLLEWYGKSTFEGKRCTIVGRSPNVGRAAALLMMHRQATVTVCHTRTSPEHLKESLKSADFIIVAAGHAGVIQPTDMSKSAWAVDVGTNATADGKLVGDIAPWNEGEIAAISPVPGGVGPITVAMLLANLLFCASRRRLGEGNGIMLPDMQDLK